MDLTQILNELGRLPSVRKLPKLSQICIHHRYQMRTLCVYPDYKANLSTGVVFYPGFRVSHWRHYTPHNNQLPGKTTWYLKEMLLE